MNYMIMPLKRFFDFSGRSRRKEYWLFVLFQIIVYAVLGMLAGGLGAGAGAADLNPSDAGVAAMVAGLGLAFIIPALLFLIPTIAVTVRRFHDQNMSGWWALLSLVPLVSIVVFIFMLIGGTRGPNRFGPDPRNPQDLGETFA